MTSHKRSKICLHSSIAFFCPSLLAHAGPFGDVWMIIPDKQRASGCWSIIKTWWGFFSSRNSSLSVASPIHAVTQFPIHTSEWDNGVIASGGELIRSFRDSYSINVLLLNFAILSCTYSWCLIWTLTCLALHMVANTSMKFWMVVFWSELSWRIWQHCCMLVLKT